MGAFYCVKLYLARADFFNLKKQNKKKTIDREKIFDIFQQRISITHKKLL